MGLPFLRKVSSCATVQGFVIYYGLAIGTSLVNYFTVDLIYYEKDGDVIMECPYRIHKIMYDFAHDCV